MAERGRAAVDVDPVVRYAQVVHREHRDAGEGLVDLEQIDVADRPAGLRQHLVDRADGGDGEILGFLRSEEHTSELQSLMSRSYAVFCLKKNKQKQHTNNDTNKPVHVL